MLQSSPRLVSQDLLEEAGPAPPREDPQDHEREGVGWEAKTDPTCHPDAITQESGLGPALQGGTSANEARRGPEESPHSGQEGAVRTKEGVAREGLAEGPRGASNTESQTGPAPAQGLGEGTADGDRELGSASEGTGVPTEDVRQDPDWHRRASKVSTHERFWTQN